MKPYLKAGLVLFIGFTILICFGCNLTPGQQKKKLIRKYSRLSQAGKDQELCDLLNPIGVSPHIRDTLKVISVIEAGADVNRHCEYSGKKYSFWSLFGAEPTNYTVSHSPTLYFFLAENISLLDLAFNRGGRIDSSMIESTMNIKMWEYLFSKGWTLKNFKEFDFNISQNKELIDFLILHGFGINDPMNSQGATIFYALSSLEQHDDTTMFSYLYHKGADINYASPDLWNPPIFNIIHNHNTKVFDWMVKNGAEIKGIKSRQGKTMLQFMVEESRHDELLEMVKILLKVDPEVNERKKWKLISSYMYEESALGWAIYGRNNKIASVLLDHGADISYPFSSSDNAFEMAISYHDPELLQLLLDKRPKEAQVDKLIAICEDRIEWWKQQPDWVEKCKECLEILKKYKK